MRVRQSNFELMRIVSMFMIIVWHLFLYGVNMDTASPSLKLVFDFFRSIMVVHVNSFILISGYFLINSEFKMSKLLADFIVTRPPASASVVALAAGVDAIGLKRCVFSDTAT